MIWLYSEICTPRLQYITALMFDKMAGLPCRITTFKEAFENEKVAVRINYSNEIIDGTWQIKPCGILSETGINKKFKDLFIGNSENYLNPVFKDKNAEFDFIGMAFFLVSRYEEYLPFKGDAHDRFPAKNSLLFKTGLLKKPIVNIWVKSLQDILNPNNSVASNQKINILPTIDVDVAFRYKSRGVLRHFASVLKDLKTFNVKNISERFKVLKGFIKDPNDTFEYQSDLFKKHGLDAKYFMQVGKYGKYNKNLDPKDVGFTALIKNISLNCEVGIHPGYDSVEKEELKSEIKILSNITGKKIISGRQHFLKFRLPETYESLYAAGIRKEYSMGYSDETGFRAGIAFPFNWFNLEKEIETDLEILPFCVMDVALQHFQNLSPEEAIRHCFDIKKSVKDCDGYFSFVFHNESLSETNQWVGWRPVFEFLLSE